MSWYELARAGEGEAVKVVPGRHVSLEIVAGGETDFSLCALLGRSHPSPFPGVNGQSKEKWGYIYLGETRMGMWQEWCVLMVSQWPPVTIPASPGAYKDRVVDIAE